MIENDLFVKLEKCVRKVGFLGYNKDGKENVKWNWEVKQKKVFEELKKRFIIESVLVTSDLDKEMRVETDASDFSIEEVLSMKYENKKRKLVAYISKLLNKAKRNYEIHNKEILIIIWCLEI